MTAEEAAMIMMSGGGDKKIRLLSVTENKEYHASDYGCDGFDPVVVNVPDRYQDGYNQGCNDTRNEIETNPDDPTHKKIYDEGYADGTQSGEYVFPDGTSFDDVFNISGGTGNVVDKTLGCYLGVKYIHSYDAGGRDYYTTIAGIFDSATNQTVTGGHFYQIGNYSPVTAKIISADTATGNWTVEFTYTDNGNVTTRTMTGKSTALVGFGAAGHQIAAANQSIPTA